MSSTPHTQYERLSPEEAARIDAACDRFEKAWKASRIVGDAPRLADFLDQSGPERTILAHELVALDRACRERYGLPIRPDDYTALGIPADARAAHVTGTPPAGPCLAEGWPSVPGFQLLDVLGSGGMGIVFRAHQAALGRDVAVKILRDAVLSGSGPRERFAQEARAVARLHHPHLVQVYDFGDLPGAGAATSRPYLVLEYVAGGSLAERLHGVPQSPKDAARLVELLADAIHYAHEQGIIHRDLKPANILLSAREAPVSDGPSGVRVNGRNFIPKIGDFGLAKFLSGANLTQTGEVLGTPSYMAPEQTVGKIGGVTAASDVYGLGAILYEVLTGRPPFLAATAVATVIQVQHEEPVPPHRLQPTVPRDLETICLKCLRKEPGARYPSAKDLARDLHRFLLGESIQARPVGAPERLVRWCRRKPAVAALLLLVVAVAALGLAGIVWQWRQTAAALDKSEQAHEATKAHLYLNQIAHARHELLANHHSRAERLLEETPESLRGWEWRYLKQLCQANLFVLRAHDGPVQSVAYSPDGGLLAAGSGGWYSNEQGELDVWDAHTGELRRFLTADIGTVYGVAFHPDSRRLASASGDSKVRIWDLADGQARILPGFPKESRPANRATSVAFTPDGRRLLAGSRDQKVRLWEVDSGKLLYERHYHSSAIWGVAISPDGRQFASCDRNGIAHLWDAESGTPVRTFAPYWDYRAVGFSPDGTRLGLGGYLGQILQFDLTRKDSQALVHHLNAGPILSLVFTPNGSLAWSSREGDVRITDPASGKDRYVVRGHDSWVNSVSVSPDGRRIASGGEDGSVRISDATLYEKEPSYVTDGAQLPAVMFDKDGALYALGGRRNAAEVWTVRGDWPEEKIFLSLPTPVVPTAAAGSLDGRLWAWVVRDKLQVYDRARQAETWSKQHSEGAVTALAFSVDSRTIAWGSEDGYVHLCDAATGIEVGTLGPHGGRVTGLAFHPNGELLATAGQDRSFCLWRISTGREVTRFRETDREGGPMQSDNVHSGHPQATSVTRLAFSPDGRRLAVSNSRRPMEIWDVASGRVVLVLDWDAEGASSAAWSVDGNRLAVACGKRVKVFDAAVHTLAERRQATEGSAIAWHEREVVFGRQRYDWFAAAYHLGKLIEAKPANANLYTSRVEARAHLADVGRGRWQDALADAARAVSLDPFHAEPLYQQSLLTLAAGDEDGYRTLCKKMLSRFGRTNEPRTANIACVACTMAPGAVRDPAQLISLARRGQREKPADPRYLNLLGVASYRAGDFASARKYLAASAETPSPLGHVWDWLYLAMTDYQMGQAEDARSWLNKAGAALDNTTVEQPPPGWNLDRLPFWNESLELRLLRREATALIAGAKQTNRKP
jgi:WD40 repeat protein